MNALHVHSASSASSEVGATNAAWFPDFGASHHLKKSSMNVSNASPYNGQGKICVGNGNTIHISHTGTSRLHYNNQSAVLKNILIAPIITKNLLYVSQFVKDNHAYFVLVFPWLCCKGLDNTPSASGRM